MSRKFQRRPGIIEAVRWDGTEACIGELTKFLGGAMRLDYGDPIIPTPEGDMRAPVGWWVVKGVEGEWYTCRPSVFEKNYEEIA